MQMIYRRLVDELLPLLTLYVYILCDGSSGPLTPSYIAARPQEERTL